MTRNGTEDTRQLVTTSFEELAYFACSFGEINASATGGSPLTPPREVVCFASISIAVVSNSELVCS